MPYHHRITLVGTTARAEPHACIAYVGGGSADTGTLWQLSQDEAIDYIESGRGRLWLRSGGRSRWVVVARLKPWQKYLKTLDDDVMPASLLDLAMTTASERRG